MCARLGPRSRISIATLDLAGAYVGAETYESARVGASLFIATFLGPLLAHAAFLEWLARAPAPGPDVGAVAGQATALRIWSLAIYWLVLLVHREHLFVWTVFAPRFLYDAAFTVEGTLEMCLLCLIPPGGFRTSPRACGPS